MILTHLPLTTLHSCTCYTGHIVPLLAPTAINAIYLLTTDSKLSSNQIPGHAKTVARALLIADLVVTDLAHLRHSVALVAINLVLGRRLTNTQTTERIAILDTVAVHQEDLDRFFPRAQTPPHAQSVPSALVASPTESNSASRINCGTRKQMHSSIAETATSSPQTAELSAKIFRDPTAVKCDPTTRTTDAQDAENPTMVLRLALELRKSNAHTPYAYSAWCAALTHYGLLSKYPNLPSLIQFGFDVGIHTITSTFTPPNKASIEQHAIAFEDYVNNEFRKGRYLGPFTQAQIESILGPFQSSPLSIIPKPGRVDKFRLLQNLSFPYSPGSINHTIDSDLYPCIWSTFGMVCTLLWHLPPGSEAAVRDIAEAHRTIPVIPEQWPGLVVRLRGVDCFAVDTCGCFGLASISGSYGYLADAQMDLIRAAGIGPICKWANDHLFICIPREYLLEYNQLRSSRQATIAQNGGWLQTGGRHWFQGSSLPDGRIEEFDDDNSFPIQDLSNASPRSNHDCKFTYSLADIDDFTCPLGTPWEPSKDIPFGTVAPFIGFDWDLANCTVSLPLKKTDKYLAAITEWEQTPKHNLHEVQGLYGKLLHASSVMVSGRAYLTKLEAMLGSYGDNPFAKHTPPIQTADDLKWWKFALSQPPCPRRIPGPSEVFDFAAFSDASSSTGIGIIIKGRWRAWCLIPGWKTDGRDIGWAESIGFEFLVRYIVTQCTKSTVFKTYGDNRGVVEGWWKGCSRNWPTNLTFRRIYKLLAPSESSVLTRYVPSASNPANSPSRGKYPSMALLLPPIHIPVELRDYVIDFDAPLTPVEFHLDQRGQLPKPLAKLPHDLSSHAPGEINAKLEHKAWQLFTKMEEY